MPREPVQLPVAPSAAATLAASSVLIPAGEPQSLEPREAMLRADKSDGRTAAIRKRIVDGSPEQRTDDVVVTAGRRSGPRNCTPNRGQKDTHERVSREHSGI